MIRLNNHSEYSCFNVRNFTYLPSRAPYLIMLTTFPGQAILLEASLSYLGLGVQEPTAAWGLMRQGGAVLDTFDPKLRAR